MLMLMEKRCWKSLTWHVAQPVRYRYVRESVLELLKAAFCHAVEKLIPAFAGPFRQYGTLCFELERIKALGRGS